MADMDMMISSEAVDSVEEAKADSAVVSLGASLSEDSLVQEEEAVEAKANRDVLIKRNKSNP